MITVDFDRLDIKPGFKVLDMGCGSGRHTRAVSLIDGALAVGADLCYGDVREAVDIIGYQNALLGKDRRNWTLNVADITRLPFPDQCFDVVICSEVLEHIPDHEKAVSELARVLKPGCDMVISVPRAYPERICWALSDEYPHEPGGHIRIYRKEQILDMLRRAGLSQWGQGYAHALHSPYWWLKCAVGHKNDDHALVRLYKRLLVWDMMNKPRLTRTLEKLLNPVMGKSIVFYLRKN